MFTIDEMRKRAKTLVSIMRNLSDVTLSDDEVTRTKDSIYYYQAIYRGKKEFGQEEGTIKIVFMKDKTIAEFHLFEFITHIPPQEVTFIA